MLNTKALYYVICSKVQINDSIFNHREILMYKLFLFSNRVKVVSSPFYTENPNENKINNVCYYVSDALI